MHSSAFAAPRSSSRGVGTGRTFVGIHVPKCAGTTLRTRVAAELPAEEFFQNSSVVENFRHGRPEFLDIAEPSRLRFLFGHSIHEEMLKIFPNPIFFTGLREPVARLRSHIAFRMRKQGKQNRPSDIEAFARVSNPMCTILINCCPQIARRNSGDSPSVKARRVLEACSFVYFTHSFEATTEPIFRGLGIQPEKVDANVAGGDTEIDIDETLFDIAEDRLLYDWALDRFGGIDIEAAIAAGTRVPPWFLRAPVRLPELRAFLIRMQTEEYQSWGVLDAVMARKMSALANLRAELDAYSNAHWAEHCRADGRDLAATA